jgi:hypothetical protein
MLDSRVSGHVSAEMSATCGGDLGVLPPNVLMDLIAVVVCGYGLLRLFLVRRSMPKHDLLAGAHARQIALIDCYRLWCRVIPSKRA